MSLPALLAYTGSNRSTDPRERIYSLLSLTPEVDKLIVGLPISAIGVEEVYRKYVIDFINTRLNMDILWFAQLFRSRSLPSWVPPPRSRIW